MSKKKFNAILLSAGTSSRFNSSVPKQYLYLGKKQILDYSIDQIYSHSLCDLLVVVVNKDYRNFYNSNLIKDKRMKFVFGGESRQQSVINGIKSLPSKDNLLLIHDAARPGIDHDIINKLIKILEKNVSCAIPLLPQYDSLLKYEKKSYISVNRQSLFRIQTPQVFQSNSLKLNDFFEYPDATDESEIIVKKGKKLKTIPGKEKLLKITTEWDYMILKKIMNKSKEYRTGTGFDVHAFSLKPSKLVLGGIEIDHQYGLMGHSDADVLLHSITDAILGSVSKGDIGTHFPPTDKKWKNIESSVFLKKSIDILIKEGGELINIDTTVICEEPKIYKYNKKIINNISILTNLKTDRISIKATTTEKLGFLGRNEGIAVMSSVMIKI
jgi:2-C-methyl-D-erythritol 4-phosphate cytidylyltransferase/2-C-methyl-D-erythritol 2,4-cyclodiphosphate synthase